MHSLSAKRLYEGLGVLLPPKPKDLVPLLLPDNRVTEARQRKTTLRAELADFSYCVPVHFASINATQ
jgi:hypothetical protein